MSTGKLLTPSVPPVPPKPGEVHALRAPDAMSIIYTIYYTVKAARSFQDLNKHILQKLSPADRATAKIINIYLSNAHGNWLHPEQQKYRYIRVVIDVPRSRVQTIEAKQELLQQTVAACLEYQAKHSDECEVEVKINEVDESNVLSVNSRGARIAA